MIIIGIVLLVLALAALGFVIYGSSGADSVTFEAFGLAVETSPLVVFLSGAAMLLLALLGLMAVRAGARRSARNRSEMNRLRRVEAEAQARQAEEAQRQRELDERRAAEAQRQAAARQAAGPADPTVTATSHLTTRPTGPVGDHAVADTPFGRESAADTVVAPSTHDSSSGSTAR